MKSLAYLCVFALIFTLSIFSQNAHADTFLLKFGSQGFGDGQFYGSIGLAIDSSDNIYVTDFGNSRIEIFSSEGVYLSQFGSVGSGNGEFSGPYEIAFDSSGNIYVVDWTNDRIQKFSSEGVYLSQFGSLGDGNGQFFRPEGIAFDSSGNIYVADWGNNRIQKFSSEGVYLSQFGSSGSGNGQFENPTGITIDSSDNIYVSDNNSRIQKFSSEGVYLSQFGSGCLFAFNMLGCIDPDGSGPLSLGDGQMTLPVGIAFDSSGNIYVADWGNNRIQKFSSEGVFLSKFGSYGSGDGQFDGPYNIAFDSFGNIYVTDGDNHRIQKFRTSTSTTTAPSAITDLVATAGNTQVTLSWSAPNDGGSSITDYIIEYKLSTATSYTTFNDNVSATTGGTVTGLTNDVSYDFIVFAVNAIGTSATSNVITISTDSSLFTPWTQTVIDLRASKSQSFQDQFPIATTADINRLLAWAGNPTVQTNNPSLQQFGHMYSPMKRWNERTDLQNGFPTASLGADMVPLLIWSGKDNVLANSFNSDLVPHAATYKLLRIYFLERDDLRNNPAYAGALDGSDPSRLYCWAKNSQDTRLTPHQSFYAANCVP